MTARSQFTLKAAALLAAVGLCGFTCRAATPEAPAPAPASAPSEAPQKATPHPDRTGKLRRGKASFYAKKFAGRQMADGNIMDPQANNAASRTLPLGTVAKVTNLETGQSTVITIQDRGPYAHGRIVDLSPTTAQNIGITQDQGIASVAVAPITVPLPDGGVKLGAAATTTDVKKAGSGKKDKPAARSHW